MTAVRELMTPNPVKLKSTEPVSAAARTMRDEAIGAVIVVDDATLRGIVTDRDIAVRIVADGMDPDEVSVGDLCSTELHTVSPNDSLSDAIRTMNEHALRRVPVVEDQVPVGVLALGDLAVERDPDSLLGAISAAPPNA